MASIDIKLNMHMDPKKQKWEQIETQLVTWKLERSSICMCVNKRIWYQFNISESMTSFDLCGGGGGGFGVFRNAVEFATTRSKKKPVYFYITSTYTGPNYLSNQINYSTLLYSTPHSAPLYSTLLYNQTTKMPFDKSKEMEQQAWVADKYNNHMALSALTGFISSSPIAKIFTSNAVPILMWREKRQADAIAARST
ncbi:unnamed protein product [Ambrosiozyma monospora]|uniref:Unnamed protein product n=1 Tax=Ambrosiozyma monospora TaxID=43982 RepID=A0A9W6Z343_AMBMO|nr:unnamed protein product [Ambrosiozyma monospora]